MCNFVKPVPLLTRVIAVSRESEPRVAAGRNTNRSLGRIARTSSSQTAHRGKTVGLCARPFLSNLEVRNRPMFTSSSPAVNTRTSTEYALGPHTPLTHLLLMLFRLLLAFASKQCAMLSLFSHMSRHVVNSKSKQVCIAASQQQRYCTRTLGTLCSSCTRTVRLPTFRNTRYVREIDEGHHR